MANKFYPAVALTGGGTGALDKIDGMDLSDLDAAMVVTGNKAYFYTLDDSSGASESSPGVISPDTNAGNKRWILKGNALIGDYKGNWAASTAYVERELVKDTSNNNIYYCSTSHTSSGSQPISTNADSAKWTLIVDAAAAATSATAAAASETAAAASETAAAASETAAETAETNAETAETNAETAETNAETAETNAGNSATAAGSSATSAASSATSATSSASTATTQASNASTSATNASTSASAASTSASAASTSATAAAASETAAETAETNAETAETNAETAETNAETAETNAGSSATAAASSATSAASSATSATSSASTATTQASNASTSATNASTSASAASTSASAASTSASNASTSASNASTSASNASTSETNTTAAASALAWKYTFDSTTSMNDPGAGEIRFDNATVASVTNLAMDATSADAGNPDVSDLIASIDDGSNDTHEGYVTIRKSGTPATFACYSVTGAVVDNTGWLQVPVTHVASNGTISNTDTLYIAFTRTGAKGATGSTGPAGAGSDTPADNIFRIQDNGDTTKQIAFEASGISTSTTRTITMPDRDITLAATPVLGDKNILTTGKTISENITFAGTENGVAIGPVTVANTYTVVVSDGSRFVIL